MATIKDVAKAAGVGISTVSYVINDSKPVKAETREKVLNAIKQVNYQYNPLAANLKSAKNGIKTIGVVGLVDKNPYFSELFFELENACYQKGYSMLSVFCRDDDKAQKVDDIPKLLQGRVDGLIVVSTSGQQAKHFLEMNQAIPSVVISSELPRYLTYNSNQFELNLNDYSGGYLAGSYLCGKGHRTFACITGPLQRNITEQRLSGFRDAISDKGNGMFSVEVIESNYTFQGGYDALNQIYTMPNRPTAVFCLNDICAIGAINAAHSLKLSIPDDIAIMGYDNIDASTLIYPSVTTIEAPRTSLATQAVTGVVNLINKNQDDIIIEVKPTLKVRQSA